MLCTVKVMVTTMSSGPQLPQIQEVSQPEETWANLKTGEAADMFLRLLDSLNMGRWRWRIKLAGL